MGLLAVHMSNKVELDDRLLLPSVKTTATAATIPRHVIPFSFPMMAIAPYIAFMIL